MSFIGIWIITVVTSSIWELKNELEMFKEFADNGYKLNINKMKEIQTDIAPQTSNNVLLSMLIPFYNVASVIRRKNLYENNKQLIFDQYDKLGVLEEMTEAEKEEYAKNPSGWNAVLLTAKESNEQEVKKTPQPKSNDKMQIVKMIIHEENGQTNTIKVRMDTSPNSDRMEIIEISGSLINLSQQEVVNYVLEQMDMIMKSKDIKIIRTNELIEITLTKTKPKTKLERYIELRDSLKANGYLYGEEMCEYRDLEKELGPSLSLTNKKNF